MSASESSSPTSSNEELLSIGDVAEATGISTETLRMWERRYGRPEAVRLPSGHRRYTAEHVRWLRRIAEALARGHRPGALMRLDECGLDDLLVPEVDEKQDEEIQRLLDAVRAYDGDSLRVSLLAAWMPNRCLGFLEERLHPLIEAIGREWADGALDVRHEHFASEVIEDVLRQLRTSLPVHHPDPGILLTTLSGETHRLGLQMAALLCAARGLPTRILGIDTPSLEILKAVREVPTDIVGVSVSLSTGGVDTDKTLSELRKALPDEVRLVVGGAGARGIRRGPRGIEYLADLAAWDKVIADFAATC